MAGKAFFVEINEWEHSATDFFFRQLTQTLTKALKSKQKHTLILRVSSDYTYYIETDEIEQGVITEDFIIRMSQVMRIRWKVFEEQSRGNSNP